MHIADIKSVKDLYEILNTNYYELNTLVNESNQELYKKVSIPKKNGSHREIYIPNEKLLRIQKKLKIILDNSYNPHINATGFIKNRSIIDNATKHVNKKYIINIDLENFFTTITSGRVYAMFDKYFKVSNRDVCFLLTRLCCHPDNFLPQGAPTSPTISNIISKQLDKHITIFLKKQRYTVHYSRYADDITLSSNYPFSEGVLSIETDKYQIGSKIKQIIDDNGFRLNDSKTRFQKYNQHQEVTGIVVNEKLNVNRKFIRNIRATLHSIKMDCDDLEKPVNKFNTINKTNIDTNGMFKSIRGKIEYVGMVKGYHDKVYISLANNYNQTLELVNEMLEIEGKEALKSIGFINVYTPNYTYLVPDAEVIFSKDSSMGYGQGSAFLLKDYGIVSNYHVFEQILDEYYPINAKATKFILFDYGLLENIEYPLKLLNMKNNRRPEVIHTKVVKFSKELDLVLLEPQNINFCKYGYNLSSESFKLEDSVRLLGFPNFKLEDEVRGVDAKIIAISEANKKFEINETIFSGNSGGPILNSKNEVIGVASEGTGTHENIGRMLEWLVD